MTSSKFDDNNSGFSFLSGYLSETVPTVKCDPVTILMLLALHGKLDTSSIKTLHIKGRFTPNRTRKEK